MSMSNNYLRPARALKVAVCTAFSHPSCQYRQQKQNAGSTACPGTLQAKIVGVTEFLPLNYLVFTAQIDGAFCDGLVRTPAAAAAAASD